jgi:hypothetical protein
MTKAKPPEAEARAALIGNLEAAETALTEAAWAADKGVGILGGNPFRLLDGASAPSRARSSR